MKKTPKILIYTSLFLLLNGALKNLTGDFSESFLLKPAAATSDWANDKNEAIRPVLNQKYTYLGRGLQAYAFLSEDGEHVLKVFKPLFPAFSYSLFGKKFKLGLSKIPFARELFLAFSPNTLDPQKEKDFLSYTNSFSFLQEQTGLEYLHLAETEDLNHKLELYDKIGVQHFLNLDTSCFLIQKKADLLYPTLGSLIKNQEIDKAKELIDSFVSLSFEFIQKGILSPTTLKKNFGCVGLKAIQIDVGRVFKKEDLGKNEAPSTEQIYHSTSTMKKWLKDEAPELSVYLEEAIQKQKEIYEQTSP